MKIVGGCVGGGVMERDWPVRPVSVMEIDPLALECYRLNHGSASAARAQNPSGSSSASCCRAHTTAAAPIPLVDTIVILPRSCAKPLACRVLPSDWGARSDYR